MSFALIGRMLANRVGIAQKPASQGPLASCPGPLQRIHVGGLLDLSGAEASFIMAEASNALTKRPAGIRATIRAYGRCDDGAFVIHRFYLGSQTAGDPDYFLQVVTQNGQIVDGEIKLFQKLTEVVPATPDEWDLWLKGSDTDPPLLTGPTLNWQNQFEFKRVWLPGTGNVAPRSFLERLTVGADWSQVALDSMLYGRQLDGGRPEWLQMSVCRTETVTGTERWIEAYVGLPLDIGELNAL